MSRKPYCACGHREPSHDGDGCSGWQPFGDEWAGTVELGWIPAALVDDAEGVDTIAMDCVCDGFEAQLR